MKDSKTILIKNKKVSYFDTGKGPTLILLHGWLGCKELFLELINKLDTRFRLLVPDFPGFGDSEKYNSTYSFKLLSDFVLDFSNKLNTQNFYILGNSMGGNIVLELLKNSPESIKKAIIRATPITSDQLPNALTKKYVTKIFKKASKKSKLLKISKPIVKYGFKKTILPTKNSKNYHSNFEIADQVLKKFDRIYPQVVADLGVSLLECDYTEVLKNTDKEILYLQYKNDSLISNKNNINTLSSPHIHLQYFPGKHSLMHEDFDRFSKLITDYFFDN